MSTAASARLLRVLLLALPVCACSDPAPTPNASGATVAATDLASPKVPATPEAKPLPKACELLGAKEMSAILGAEVSTQANEGSSGKTECIYSPLKGISPYAEFSVEWGEGQSAMDAAGAMAKQGDGMVNPYAGIGDQAVAVGTSLMIRRGQDLVTITLSGVDNMPEKARRIFDTASAKL